MTKRDQEELCLSVGRAYGLPTVALRFFNVYGRRQSLSNPYTGFVAIALSRVLNGEPPLIFEDGCQTRDFVHVDDVVEANLLALTNDEGDYQALNVGTGRPTTILEVAEHVCRVLDSEIAPEVTERYREGDVRHCFADISSISRRLGYQPRVDLADGLTELAQHMADEDAVDLVEHATAQLERRGLLT